MQVSQSSCNVLGQKLQNPVNPEYWSVLFSLSTNALERPEQIMCYCICEFFPILVLPIFTCGLILSSNSAFMMFFLLPILLHVSFFFNSGTLPQPRICWLCCTRPPEAIMNGSHRVVDNGTANVILKPLASLFCYRMHWNIDEPPSTPSTPQIFASDRWTLWYYPKPNKQDCLLLTEAVQLCRPCCFKARGERMGEHPAQWTGCYYFHLTASRAQFYVAFLKSCFTLLLCFFTFWKTGRDTFCC